MKTVIVSGNSNFGLGPHIKKIYPETKFCSRTCGGYDFETWESRNRFAIDSLDFDVVILCSSEPVYSQISLAQIVRNAWLNNSKRGLIIAIGSTADHSFGGDDYPIAKRALKDYCRSYGWQGGFGSIHEKSNGVKMTYVAPGILSLPYQLNKHGNEKVMLSPDYFISVLKWIIDQPEEVVIYNLSCDGAQCNA